MVSILVITHGEMAAGMIDSLKLIAGEPESVESVALIAGQDFEDFKAEIKQKIKALDKGNGVLVLVDLFGASPYNASMFLFNELRGEGNDIRIVTGVSLSMLLETNAMKEFMSLEELANHAVSSGREGIQEPVSDLLSSATAEDEDEGDY